MNPRLPAAVSIAAIAAIAALTAVATPTADAAQTDPPGWTRVDTGPFSVALPPGWRYESNEGFDSLVGFFVGDGLRLEFDYGAYWLSPPQDDARHVVQHVRIDFRSAVILRPREPQEAMFLFIEHTDDFGDAFGGRGGGPTHLTIAGRVPPDEGDRIEQIFRTVRFRRWIGEGGRWERVEPPAGEGMLLDLDLFGGREPWVVGGRVAADGTAVPLAFRPTGGGWDERPLGDAKGLLAISGNWVVSQDALFRYDDQTDEWQRERTVDPGVRLLDVAVDRSFENNQGWAIGSGILRLADGRSTEADGGWGTASGMAIDVLPRGRLAPIARPEVADAMAVGGADGASLFDGWRWRAMGWDPGEFFSFDVDLVAADEAWIVGTDPTVRGGVFRHRLGDIVAAAPVTASNTILAVDMLSGAEGWAVGGGTAGGIPAGELWRFSDGVWGRQPTPCECQLWAVQAQPNGAAWAVGHTIGGPGPSEAVVLRYVPPMPTATPDASATAAEPTESATAAASRTATASATRQTGEHRVWLPWANKPLLAR